MQLLATMIQAALLANSIATAQPIDRQIVDVSPNGQWVVQSTAEGLVVVDLHNQQAAPLAPLKRIFPYGEQAVIRVSDGGDLYLIDTAQVTLYRKQDGEFKEFGQEKWQHGGELQSALVIPNSNDLHTHRFTSVSSQEMQEYTIFAVHPEIGFHRGMSGSGTRQYTYHLSGLSESGIVLMGSYERHTASTYSIGSSSAVLIGPLSRRVACSPDFVSVRNDVRCGILTCNDGVDEGLYLGDDYLSPQIDWKQVEIAADTNIVAGMYVSIDADDNEALVLQILWDGFIFRGIELDLESPRLRQVTQSEMYPLGLAVVTRDEIFSLSLIDARPALRKVY